MTLFSKSIIRRLLPLPLFITGYFSFLYGVSILASDWLTDIMLHNQFSYFNNFSLSYAPELHQTITSIEKLADVTSVFSVLGIMITIPGIAAILIGLYSLKIEKPIINPNHINWKKLPPSNNSLAIIGSTLFAVSLIFVTIADQARSNTEETIFTTMLMINENQTSTNTINVILSESISHDSFVYFSNLRQATFTAQLSLTFLIMSAIRYTKTPFAYDLNNYLLFACIIAFSVWVMMSVFDISFTDSLTPPDSNIPKLRG